MKYATYENYKNSASEWPGLVPSHWHVDRLKWSTTGCYNGVWGDEPNEIDDLICVRVADFDRDQFVVVSNPSTVRAIEIAQRRNRILQKNDLLIEKSGGGEKQLVGCVVQFTGDFPAVCSNFVARLPVARGCDPRYLTYLHSAIYVARLNYPAIKQTTGIQNLDSGEYLNILAAYPPLAEQQTIARFLDAKTAQIDALVAQKRQLIDKLKEKWQALIARTVTRGLPPEAAKAAGLEPNPEMKDSGVEWLGEIPEHWQLKCLKYLFRCFGGGTPSKANAAFWDGNVPWVSPKDMGEKVIFDTEDHITPEAIIESATRLVEPGATLIVVRSGILKHTIPVATNAVSVTLNQDMKALVSGGVVKNPYLAYFIECHNRSLLETWSKSGCTVESIESEYMLSSLIPVAPGIEQKAIVNYLDLETERIDVLTFKVETAITRLSEYRQALITSAVTGKIDVRNWQSGLEAA